MLWLPRVPLLLSAWLLWGTGRVQAQTTASFQFPVVDGLTVNYIDTVVLQWTSNYASPILYMWCQNGTTGNNVLLASEFDVQTSGKLGYVISTDDPDQSAFPVACHAQLVPTANGAGVDSPVGITFTSQANVAAKTVSLSSSASSSTSAIVTSASVSTGLQQTSSAASAQSTSKPTTTILSSAQTTSGTSETATPTALTNGTESTSSSPSSISTSSTNSNADVKSSGNSTLGAIVGGALGGAALLCLIVFGVLFLRKYNRREIGQRLSGGSKRKTWWSGVPGMDRRSVYEVDGMDTARHEKEGTLPLHEKEASTTYAPVELG